MTSRLLGCFRCGYTRPVLSALPATCPGCKTLLAEMACDAPAFHRAHGCGCTFAGPKPEGNPGTRTLPAVEQREKP